MAPHEIPVKRLRWPGFRDLASISFVKLRSDCKIKKRRPILGSWKYEHSISVTRTNFFQVCVRLPWKKASSAPLGTETGKGNHNFSNVVRALHLTLKWREDYLSFIIYFNQQSATPAELKPLLPRNETSRANYLSSMRPCNILYFLRETTHICKYLKIHRLSWAMYILPLSIGLRQIDPFDRQYAVIILRSLSRSQFRRRNCY